MPISDGLWIADLCRTGTPGSLGDYTVFPNTGIPSQPTAAEPQPSWSGENAHVLSFQSEEKGRLGPQRVAQMAQMSSERASFRMI